MKKLNVIAYINSGILEQYVLGLLSSDEAEEVEIYAKTYPSIQNEIQNIEITLENFAQLFAIPIPEELDEKIKANFQKQKK